MRLTATRWLLGDRGTLPTKAVAAPTTAAARQRYSMESSPVGAVRYASTPPQNRHAIGMRTPLLAREDYSIVNKGDVETNRVFSDENERLGERFRRRVPDGGRIVVAATGSVPGRLFHLER